MRRPELLQKQLSVIDCLMRCPVTSALAIGLGKGMKDESPMTAQPVELNRPAATPPAGQPTVLRRRWHHRLPLFVHIFLVVLGAVFGAQALNFAILLLVRLPEPAVHPLNEIAEVLRSGEASPSLILSLGAPPPADGQDQRDLETRVALAARLGMSEERLRVIISRPPGFFMHNRREKSLKDAKRHERRSEAGSRDLIVGHFSAALRLDDGQWRRVWPKAVTLEPWQWQALLWLCGTLLVAAPLAWFIARRIAAPIDLFSAAVERIGRDPAASPLGPDGPPELTPAVLALNEMQARLKRYVEDRTTMVAAIAHDLRTPLMRLTLLLEEAPASVQEPAEAEIREMTERIRGTLAFVRDLNRPMRRQRLNLRSLIESVADEMADRGGSVEVKAGPDVVIDADIAGLRALFVNVIGNAVQYAGSAEIDWHCSEGQILVQVDDSGPGIPGAHLEKVFEPFYRVEGSRNRTTGGTGLGLASARAVARAHGGDLTLTNRAEGGLSARLRLPLNHGIFQPVHRR